MTKTTHAQVIASWVLFVVGVAAMLYGIYHGLGAFTDKAPMETYMRPLASTIAGVAAYLASRFLSPYEDEVTAAASS